MLVKSLESYTRFYTLHCSFVFVVIYFPKQNQIINIRTFATHQFRDIIRKNVENEKIIIQQLLKKEMRLNYSHFFSFCKIFESYILYILEEKIQN